MIEPAEGHELLVDPATDVTHGTCSCGQWSRDVDHATLEITGKSREHALRDAHALHARSLARA